MEVLSLKGRTLPGRRGGCRGGGLERAPATARALWVRVARGRDAEDHAAHLQNLQNPPIERM